MMTTLYKKDNTGTIRVWEIEAEYDALVISHGQLHGTITQKRVPVSVNNSGRGISEQLDLELSSRINKQMDRGYVLDILDASTRAMANALDLPLPMLAQPVSKVKMQSDSFYLQYKYDGMRCLIHNNGEELIAYSRGGKRIESIRHITDSIEIPPGVTVDGELYLHDTPLQTIMSLAKRYQPATRDLTYVLYDVVSDEGYIQRYSSVTKIAKKSGASVKSAPTIISTPDTDIKHHLEEAIMMGYEGLILRIPSTPYEAGKRSKSLIKVKTVEDSIFLIEDITSSKDGHAILHCGNFSVLAPGTHEFKAYVYMHAGDYVGKQVRVEYANVTKDGVPFHPVATNIVED